jgi:AcrR family transcriptional regulator
MRNPKGHGDRLRVDLLDAAADLIAENGSLDAVGLRTIASRAGVSPTAVYRHFDSHKQLLSAAVDWCWTEFLRVLNDASVAADPAQRFQQMGDAYIGFATSEYGKYRVLFSGAIQRPDNPPMASEAFSLLRQVVADLLTQLDDQRDPTFVASQVHSWLHGIVDLHAQPQPPGWPALDEQMKDLVARLGLRSAD